MLEVKLSSGENEVFSVYNTSGKRLIDMWEVDPSGAQLVLRDSSGNAAVDLRGNGDLSYIKDGLGIGTTSPSYMLMALLMPQEQQEHFRIFAIRRISVIFHLMHSLLLMNCIL